MASPFVGEFLGTMILVLLGDGVVAGVLLKRSKAEGSGWMVITAGWAFAVMAGVFVSIACGSSDAHLNPAVTMGFAVRDENFASWHRISPRNFSAHLREQGWFGCTTCRTGRKHQMPSASWRVFAPRQPSAVLWQI